MDTNRDKQIEKRAYEIWEEEGRPHGRQKEHWDKAARELEEAKPMTARAPGTPEALTGTGATATAKPRRKPADKPLTARPRSKKPKAD